VGVGERRGDGVGPSECKGRPRWPAHLKPTAMPGTWPSRWRWLIARGALPATRPSMLLSATRSGRRDSALRAGGCLPAAWGGGGCEEGCQCGQRGLAAARWPPNPRPRAPARAPHLQRGVLLVAPLLLRRHALVLGGHALAWVGAGGEGAGLEHARLGRVRSGRGQTGPQRPPIPANAATSPAAPPPSPGATPCRTRRAPLRPRAARPRRRRPPPGSPAAPARATARCQARAPAGAGAGAGEGAGAGAGRGASAMAPPR
jgi:hypothetical protein